MTNLTSYLNHAEKIKSETKTILTAVFYLDRTDLINALHSEKIIVNDKYYKVPEKRLLILLSNNQSGNVELELEQII